MTTVKETMPRHESEIKIVENTKQEKYDLTYVPDVVINDEVTQRKNPPRTRRRPARYNSLEFDVNSLTISNSNHTTKNRQTTGSKLWHLLTLTLMLVIMQTTNATTESRKITTQENLGKLLGPAHVCGSTGHFATYIEIPDLPTCEWEDPRTKIVENILTTPFFPRTFSDSIKAHACRVEIEFIRTIMGFWGTKSILQRGRDYRKLDANDCIKEATYLENGISKLKETGHNIFVNDTSILKEEYHWCCKEKLFIRYRLILQQIKIRFNFHTRRLITSNFATDDCYIDQTYCDQPTVTIIWKTNITTICPLQEGNQVIGQCLGNQDLTKFTVVSEVGQFAVTGFRKSKQICGYDLYETLEGLFLRIDQANMTIAMKKAYEREHQHPLYTTNELATISFVAQELENLIYDLYRKTWLNICYLTQQRLIWIKQLANNPQQAQEDGSARVDQLE
jgi:hypothetical protein